jgi:hypothetical protein
MSWGVLVLCLAAMCELASAPRVRADVVTQQSAPDPCVSRVDVSVHRAMEPFFREYQRCFFVCSELEQSAESRGLLRTINESPILQDYLRFLQDRLQFSVDGWTQGISASELQRQRDIREFLSPILFWYPDSERYPTLYAQSVCGNNGTARYGPQYGPHNLWAVILYGDLSNFSEAQSRLTEAMIQVGCGDCPMGLLYSTDYDNLRPGYWVVYDPSSSEDEASAATAAQGWRERGYTGAYPRWLGEPRAY